ncbi:RICIN domain-containing protein [Streptomyces lincolnensis]|uniref:RICIN domain-containing protein n=1 Tax=Streptomyces lincolnensis TaxID=1915 RepID=UPI0037D6E3BA
MLTPHPPRPPYPPPGGVPEESDENLGAALRGRPDHEVTQIVAFLMARHWRQAHEYAVICLAGEDSASMVTAASFHQVLDRVGLGETAVALRPRLLVTVRETVRQWAAEDRISEVLPDLRKTAGGRGVRSARFLTPENRKLAERSFHALPGLFRCVLWHVEVEGESLTVPAALLGMDTDTASASLEQAREKFREGCVQAHRELAPTQECRYYNRLLDVPIRRGGALLPDVRQHLGECRHCRHAAEQLSHFEGGLGVLLTEAVLGPDGRRYLDTRPGRADEEPRTRGSGRHGGGRRRLLPAIPGMPAPLRRPTPQGPRSSRTLVAGVGLASAGLFTALLVGGLWTDDDGAAPAASTSATGGLGTTPGASSGTAHLPAGPGITRLRNAAAGLCVDIDGEPKAGTGTDLAACSDAPTQQWSYEDDGLLRSVAEPDLCLDSHLAAGVPALGSCAAQNAKRGDDVRYDLTVRGELLPRWDGRLALTPTTDDPDADLVVKIRDGSAQQRWLTDPVSTASPGSLSGSGTRTPSTRVVEVSDRA